MAGHEEETFDTADAGASLTFPMAAGSVRKNGFIVIKGRPCKVPLLVYHTGTARPTGGAVNGAVGCGCVHFKNGKARTCEVPLRCGGYFYGKEI